MKTSILTLTLIVLTLSGCATCPEGSLPVYGENFDQACNGKIGLSLKDKDGNIAGECKSKGPKVFMCVMKDWCNKGQSVITPTEISCKTEKTDKLDVSKPETVLPPIEPKINMVGSWSGSPDCLVVFLNDDGKHVAGKCDNGAFRHSIEGMYADAMIIQINVTRTDPNNCKTAAKGSIKIVDSKHAEFIQEGWDGCGIKTGTGMQKWTRN